MYKGMRIGVVVPAFNEEKLIARTLQSIPDYVDEIYVIDDASQDSTAVIIKEQAALDDRIWLASHNVNQGVGGAIATGYNKARDAGVDVAAVMAGDAQMDPEDLPALLDPVVKGQADYSKGNRLFSGEAYKKIPKIKYFGNAILSLLTKIASGYWSVADSQTGYTAINKKALAAIDWNSMFKRYGQPNDLLVKLNVNQFRVKEVPVKPVYDIGEKSGIKIRTVIFTIGWLLFKLFFWRLKEKYIIRDFHPLIFFYGLGFFMFFINIVFFIRLLYLWPIQGQIPEITFLICLFSFFTGLLSIFFAMLFDMEYNRHLG